MLQIFERVLECIKRVCGDKRAEEIVRRLKEIEIGEELEDDVIKCLIGCICPYPASIAVSVAPAGSGEGQHGSGTAMNPFERVVNNIVIDNKVREEKLYQEIKRVIELPSVYGLSCTVLNTLEGIYDFIIYALNRAEGLGNWKGIIRLLEGLVYIVERVYDDYKEVKDKTLKDKVKEMVSEIEKFIKKHERELPHHYKVQIEQIKERIQEIEKRIDAEEVKEDEEERGDSLVAA